MARRANVAAAPFACLPIDPSYATTHAYSFAGKVGAADLDSFCSLDFTTLSPR